MCFACFQQPVAPLHLPQSYGNMWRMLQQGFTNFLKNLRSHLKILGNRRVTQSKFQIKGPQTLGATV